MATLLWNLINFVYVKVVAKGTRDLLNAANSVLCRLSLCFCCEDWARDAVILRDGGAAFYRTCVHERDRGRFEMRSR